MSGGFFYEHVVEYFLPKSDAQKQQHNKKKKNTKSDHPASSEVPMKK